MPYIKENLRKAALKQPSDPGELNFAITMLVMDYLKELGTPSYRHMAEVMSAFEGAKMEFYRRVVVPYEKAKCAENGDVY